MDITKGDKLNCTICTKIYWYKRSTGSTKIKCASCMVNQRRFQIKERCLAEMGNSCQICGYDRCKQALVFHHINEATKSFQISGSHARSWEAIKKELTKCILLCCRCHAELHSGLIHLTGL